MKSAEDKLQIRKTKKGIRQEKEAGGKTKAPGDQEEPEAG